MCEYQCFFFCGDFFSKMKINKWIFFFRFLITKFKEEIKKFNPKKNQCFASSQVKRQGQTIFETKISCNQWEGSTCTRGGPIVSLLLFWRYLFSFLFCPSPLWWSHFLFHNSWRQLRMLELILLLYWGVSKVWELVVMAKSRNSLEKKHKKKKIWTW